MFVHELLKCKRYFYFKLQKISFNFVQKNVAEILNYFNKISLYNLIFSFLNNSIEA